VQGSGVNRRHVWPLRVLPVVRSSLEVVDPHWRAYILPGEHWLPMIEGKQDVSCRGIGMDHPRQLANPASVHRRKERFDDWTGVFLLIAGPLSAICGSKTPPSHPVRVLKPPSPPRRFHCHAPVWLRRVFD